MIIVADSGSTNTDWVIIENNKIISSFNTKGFNPYFTESLEITNELEINFPKEYSPLEIEKIFFYGAGCSSNEMNSIILTGLKPFFSKSKIEIEHDLLAAARALFINEPGIAVILGTGANTCYYDGKNIVKNVTSLGYILGDEGGGDYMGKLLITDFLNEELPDNLNKKFVTDFNLTKNQILSAIYKKPYPNRFLASFTKFILANSQNKHIENIINKTFRDLFNKHICKYTDFNKKNIRMTGSISFVFEKHIRQIATEFNAHIDLIEKEPINRLALYHIENK